MKSFKGGPGDAIDVQNSFLCQVEEDQFIERFGKTFQHKRARKKQINSRNDPPVYLAKG